jgi:hypothetical protein
MSITIHKSPQDLSPVYNQMIIAVTGSYQSQANHQFIATLFVNGSQVSRLKVPANPDGYGVFDIHKHVENRITYDFNPNWVGLNIATNSFATYSLTLAEEFRYQWGFYDNAFNSGYVAFLGPTGSAQPLFSVDDDIIVAQTDGFTNYLYEGLATITAVDFITASSIWRITTNKPFGVSTGAEGGTISLANYQLTTVTSTQSIGENFAWGGVYGYLDFINYDENNYIPNSTTPSNWLTNVPQNWEMDLDDRMWLLAYKDASNQQKDLMIQTNNGTYRITSVYSVNVETQPNKRLISAAVGPWHLINATSSITATGTASFPMIDANTKTYSVWYRNQILQQDTETLTFKIKDVCSKYEKIQLVFIDRLGSFIPYTFYRVNRNNKAITRTDYQQIYGQYAPASQAWEYNTWDRGKKSLDTVITETYTIISDWVNQATSDFLMELYESPEVYWIKEDGTTIAINLKTSNIEKKQTINDQIINYTMEFELSNKNNTRRG